MNFTIIYFRKYHEGRQRTYTYILYIRREKLRMQRNEEHEYDLPSHTICQLENAWLDIVDKDFGLQLLL